MPKIVQYNLPPGGTVIDLADNQSVALEIEQGGADYLTISTVDGSENLTIGAGPSRPSMVRFKADDGSVQNTTSGGWYLDRADASATNPVFVPKNTDTDTGIGSSGADQLSLIAGGVEGIRITEAIPSGGVTAAVVKIQDAVQYNSGTGTDTANTEPVYLADTNATMIIDFSNGNFGDITLAANVTAVKFFNAPADGTTATITAKITQDSSVRTFDYSDSAVTVYSDGGSTAVTGEIKFAGGAHHVQSTGSGAVDLVSFTCIPSGSTFNIYAAVVGQAFA